MDIFHISHTDIRSDARILKQMEVIKKHFLNYDILAIGIKNRQNANNLKLPLAGVKDLSVKLVTKNLFILPKIIIYFLNYFEFFFKIITKIYKRKKIIAVHCHDFLALPIGYAAKLLFKSKLIYDAHELESKTSYSKFPKIIFFFEKLIWKNIDLFITVSPSILKWYNKNFGHKKKSIIILNTPQIEKKISLRNYSLRKRLKIKKNKLIFIYIGGFQPGRGIDIMLKAFSNEGISSNLVFIGNGVLEKKIRKFDRKYKNIHLLKSIPHNQLVQFIKSADVGLCIIEKVSLSYYYCLPNKFFEFAFSNLHILASNFPDMKKLIKQYSLGSYISPNSSQLVKKIKFFENNKDKIKLCRKDLKNLSWKTQSKNLINNYKKIICI